MNKHNATKAGLAPCGTNEAGEQEYIGTSQEWQRADELDTLDPLARADHDFMNEKEWKPFYEKMCKEADNIIRNNK